MPGYVISNWAVLALPKVLGVNLGRDADSISASCVLPPFVHTSMTDSMPTIRKSSGAGSRGCSKLVKRLKPSCNCSGGVLKNLSRDYSSYWLIVTEAPSESAGSALIWWCMKKRWREVNPPSYVSRRASRQKLESRDEAALVRFGEFDLAQLNYRLNVRVIRHISD